MSAIVGRGQAWRLHPALVALIVACALATGWAVSASVTASHRAAAEHDLEVRAQLVAAALGDRWEELTPAARTAACATLSRAARARVTLFGVDGAPIADSEVASGATPAAAGPEVARALSEGSVAAMPWGATHDAELMAWAVAVRAGEATVGVVRLARPASDLEAALARLKHRIAWATLAVALVGVALAVLATRLVRRPLDEIRRGAERFAAGDFSQRVPVPESPEVAGVAEALNRMAALLNERLGTINRQASERQAVLSSMSEGVLAVDAQARLISLNEAAAQLLGVKAAQVEGRLLQEVVRNADLEALVQRVLREGGPAFGEVVLGDPDQRFVQVNGTVLHDAAGHDAGAVVVLNDLTRLRRLEDVRREFVANVSHELKTPVTAIKGFVETLRDGGLDDPERARRFVDIVCRQADRLDAIIEDLLALSRLERDGLGAQVPLSSASVKVLLDAAAKACEGKAAEKDASLRVTCDPTLFVRMNARLLEQAVVNLIDNAIKHGAAGKPIDIAAARDEQRVVISVRDHGGGIEAEHLPRLFERFYRVDQARSRNLGGTGLGLAIVKHIAQAHHGTVGVESEPGVGSTFRIVLPGGGAGP